MWWFVSLVSWWLAGFYHMSWFHFMYRQQQQQQHSHTTRDMRNHRICELNDIIIIIIHYKSIYVYASWCSYLCTYDMNEWMNDSVELDWIRISLHQRAVKTLTETEIWRNCEEDEFIRIDGGNIKDLIDHYSRSESGYMKLSQLRYGRGMILTTATTIK